MTRETDSSSSGPQGRGGAAYPSGTPPYGSSRPFPSLHPQERTRPAGAPDDGGRQGAAQDAAPAQAPVPGEPRTETTLTTRIRINIPGSRPIPPVVVRTTVDDAAVAAVAAEAPAPAAPAPEAEAPAEPEPEKTSDWFAPRKASAPPQGAPASGPDEPTGGAPVPGGAPASPYGREEPTGAVPLPVRNPAAAGPSPGLTPPGTRTDTAWGGSPRTEPGGAQGESTGNTPYLPPPVGGAPGGSEAARGPHDTPAGGFAAPYTSEAPPFGTGSPFDTGSQAAFGTDPAFDSTAAMPVVDETRSPFDTGSQPFGTADFPPGVPRPSDQPFPGGEDPLGIPYGPTSGPATGAMNVPPLTQDTPRPPAGANGFRPPARGGNDRVSSDTLVGGIPAVPADESRPARQPRKGAAEPEPAAAVPPARKTPAPAATAARPAKKGRSKPLLLGVAAVGVVVLAYGAGLLMNHADVPKGTTALGVDIGNQNRDAAVKMLDTALGNRATAPLALTIGGRKQSLKPSVAGLSIDTDATVRAVAHADYNPVSVIGSLFGGSRTADPVFVVDEDKLKVTLQSLAGKGSAGSDAMVRFEDHKAIAVPGKPQQTLDLAAATAQVEAAYRTRAETGADTPVVLSATTTSPRVSQAEIDRAVNGFGKTAMSGKVTVRADANHFISFNTTLPQFLTMVATPDGKLAPHIDLDAMQKLYGSRFDGVLLERGDGTKTAVTPKDVATALIQALGAENPADRTVTLQNAG
ncbi:hypothetical protein [Streptomyces sp. IBSBF 2435]|uniref:hypothetical protein n=1 Tax=Streptomyces sp. IBSBF 2435 TaxID=2903531 RepID=UPI002FDC1F56